MNRIVNGFSAVLLFLLIINQPCHSAEVEVVSQQKISATEGNFVGPCQSGGQFARSLAFIPNLNGAQHALAVGEPGADAGGDGAVWILFLDTDGSGRVASSQKNFLPVQNNKLATGFGSAVESISDLNGDNIPDLIVGDRLDEAGQCPAVGVGAVWILFMDTTGVPKASPPPVRITNGVGGITDPNTFQIGGSFGVALADLGDLRNDGTQAIAVGANQHNAGGVGNTGAVWILFLDCSGQVVSAPKLITNNQGNFPNLLQAGDLFGSSIDAIGDLDGDGVCDIAVGATLDDDGGVDHGAVWILFLNPDGTVKNQQKISDIQGSFTGIFYDRERFGGAVSSLGDIDGDGNADIAVGAVQDADGGTNRGAVWILCLKSNGTVKSHSKISSTQGGFAGPLDDVDSFGSSVEHLSGLDVDGQTTLAVGAIGDDDGSPVLDLGAIWHCFLGRPCTAGNFQNCSGEAMDVLFVNGSSGESDRTVTVAQGEDITVTLDSSDPNACPISGTYVLWAWPGLPQSPVDLIVGDPQDLIGCLVNPTPFQPMQSPQPFRCLRGQGVPGVVCQGVMEVNAPPLVPWSITKNGGLNNPITITLQGVVRDNNAMNAVGFSTTNAVILVIP